MPSKGIIVFRGDVGSPESHYSRTVIEGIIDDAALSVLATALGGHTLCNLAKRSFNTLTAISDLAPGAGANVDIKGNIYMRNPANLHLVKVSIPAPVDADFEDVGQGERYTTVALTAIVSAINTACGTAYVPLYGTKTQKP